MGYLFLICLVLAAGTVVIAEEANQSRGRYAGASRALTAVRTGLAALAAVALLTACAKNPPVNSDDAHSMPEVPQPSAESDPGEIGTKTPENPEVEETPEDPGVEETPEPVESSDQDMQAVDGDWRLILVNADHPLPENYTFTGKELRNDQWVDERIYPELQQMFDDARAEGIYPLINESFRSAERQQEILDEYVQRYLDSGLDEEAARQEAMAVVAAPGTSEHQLGLALDIVSETEEDDTATWQWLEENCWRYGFILRYPADKTEITGISYEPWHFRYVGAEAAGQIMEQGITLEEYLDGQ